MFKINFQKYLPQIPETILLNVMVAKKFCTHCGAPNEGPAQICTKCGSRFAPSGNHPLSRGSEQAASRQSSAGTVKTTEPKTLASLIRTVITGMIRNIRGTLKSVIVGMVISFILVLALHTLLLLINPAGGVNQGSNDLLTVLTSMAGQQSTPATLLFWFLLTAIIAFMCSWIRSRGLRKTLNNIATLPGWILSAVRKTGISAIPLLMGGAAIALLVRLLFLNMLTSIQFLIIMLGLLLSQQESLGVLALCLGYSDLNRLIGKTGPKIPAPGFAVMAILGAAAGFVIVLFLPDVFLVFVVFTILAIAGLLVIQSRKRPALPARAVFLFLLAIVLVALVAVPVRADTGRYPASGYYHGMYIEYTITGATVDSVHDDPSGIMERQVSGHITGDTITITGKEGLLNDLDNSEMQVTEDNGMTGASPRSLVKAGETRAFTITMPVTSSTTSAYFEIDTAGSVAIHVNGPSRNENNNFIHLKGTFTRSAALAAVTYINLPVVTSLTGPQTVTPGSSDKYTLTAIVTGGTPPYSYRWLQGTGVLFEGPQYSSVKVTYGNFYTGGSGALIDLQVTDAKQNMASWTDVDGIAHWQFSLYYPDTTHQIQRLPEYPYRQTKIPDTDEGFSGLSGIPGLSSLSSVPGVPSLIPAVQTGTIASTVSQGVVPATVGAIGAIVGSALGAFVLPPGVVPTDSGTENNAPNYPEVDDETSGSDGSDSSEEPGTASSDTSTSYSSISPGPVHGDGSVQAPYSDTPTPVFDHTPTPPDSPPPTGSAPVRESVDQPRPSGFCSSSR